MTAPEEPSADAPAWQPQAAFEVLFVCTGNLCRSPFAEALMRRLMVDRLGPEALTAFRFASAGIRATPGRPMHPGTRAALDVWAVPDDTPFASRRLDEKMIISSDLVLTMEESHRAAIAWLAGDAVHKVYGLRRFARMVQSLDPRRLPPDPVHRALRIVEWAPRLHAGLPPVPPEQEAVPDPVTGGPQEHLRSADLVFDAVATIVDVIAPPGVTVHEADAWW
ncbi:hypothetical protein [Pseudonocardia sp.]|uniref:arsenate reductase/protein-tyrosine-phosphatase family protein n=1 Tax=Pseudonocardia sp. TaxID=60912 RepID=UPI003D113C3F